MKKILAIVLLILTLVIGISPSNVFAQENAKGSNQVAINCVAKGTEAKGKRLLVYFKNIETGETFSLNIGTVGMEYFDDIPVGEYEFVKCVLADSEDIEFPVASSKKNLIVTEEEATYYAFRLEEKAVETRKGAKKDYKDKVIADGIMMAAIVLLCLIFLLWCVFALIGIKHERSKMISKFLFHSLGGILGFMLGLGITGSDLSRWYIWILCMGFPYGFLLILWIWALITAVDMEDGYVEVIRDEATDGCVSFLIKLGIAAILGFIVGIIAFPIIIIRDIVKIVQA